MPVILGRTGAVWALAAMVKARRQAAARNLDCISHLKSWNGSTIKRFSALRKAQICGAFGYRPGTIRGVGAYSCLDAKAPGHSPSANAQSTERAK
jgi:hypothetical protein